MVKRREQDRSGADYEKQVEDWAAGADGAPSPSLAPSAPRTHKKINVPFNEYEFLKLERAALRAGRSKLDYLRRAMLEQARRDEAGE